MNNLIQKYRAKLANSDTWVYGYPIIVEGNLHMITEQTFEEDGHHLHQITDEPTWIDENSLCRDSGIKTEDGIEIYQNDIIFDHAKSYRGGYYKVIYNTNRNTFELDALGLRFDLTRTRGEHYLTILGNCIDNPELLDKVDTQPN